MLPAAARGGAADFCGAETFLFVLWMPHAKLEATRLHSEATSITVIPLKYNFFFLKNI